MHFLQISAHSKSDTDEVALLRLHLIECFIERAIACKKVLLYLLNHAFSWKEQINSLRTIL